METESRCRASISPFVNISGAADLHRGSVLEAWERRLPVCPGYPLAGGPALSPR
jgi:hypothetical protein